MKTAVCFAGTGRAFQYTYDSIQHDLIESLQDCDTFFMLPTNPHAYKIGDLLDSKNITKVIVEDESDVDQTNLRFQPNWPGRANSSHQIYLKMLKSRKRCGEILTQYCKDTGTSYDRVIFSRLDVRYINFPPGSLDFYDLTKLHVPDFHNFSSVQGNGYNDRFALGSMDNMITYFNAFDKIEEFCLKGGHLHAESYLHWYLTTSNVQVRKCPIRFRRMRADGSRSEGDNRLEDTPFVQLRDDL
jgi:hypothetical protein